ncbi:hypothetical protein C7460_103151 [Marinoscillum furvescens DSM 4134]|uniref:Uncharacterized protein n=2 Tax=Marinoscillum furvescens TaxID=1026 RepID=A0A3D9L6A5_MARFU|nr:hypothetical protein C7460_103151 [Marinoscillum furvescens DSM 4134]
MQPLVHIIPLLIFLVGFFTTKIYANRNAFLQVLLFTIFYVGIGLVFGSEKSFYNVSLSLLLLLPFYMYLFRFRYLDRDDYEFLFRTVAWLSIVEFFIGLAQLALFQGFQLEFTGNAWDKVIGTTLSQSSHVYSIKMLFQGFLLLLNYQTISRQYTRNINLISIAILASFLGALISSYMIGIIMATIALIFYYSIQFFKSFIHAFVFFKINKRRVRSTFIQVSVFIVISIFGTILFAKVQPGNFKLISIVIERLISVDFSDQYKFQKIFAFEQTYQKVVKKDIGTFMFGLGAGQYSSRAALILTGDYLNPHPSYFPISMSNETRQIIFPLWNDKQQARFRGSVLAMPSSSLLSVIAEFGLIGFIILMYLFRILYSIRNTRSESIIISFVGAIPILTVLLFSQLIMDLWLEFASLTIFLNLIFIMGLSSKNSSQNGY